MAHSSDHDKYAEHFDPGHSGKDHTIHQRLRANSTIMELKKILVANRGEIPIRVKHSCMLPKIVTDPIIDLPYGSRIVFTDCRSFQLRGPS